MTTATENTTWNDKPAEFYYEQAEAMRKRREESFQRCDTDGFLS